MVRISAISAVQSGSGTTRISSSGVATSLADSFEQVQRLFNAFRAGLRARIVKRHRKIRLRRKGQTLFDQAPGFEVVAQVDRAEVVPQRRARAGRRGQHRGDAGQDRDVEVTPGRRASLNRIKHRCGHGKDTRITRGHDHHLPPLSRQLQGVAGAVKFHPVVGRVFGQARTIRHAGDIGDIAEHIACLAQNGLHIRRHQPLCTGAKPDNAQPPAHGRRPCPCTTMMEK